MRTEDARYRHLFGPVPSRRLGRSLGIDLVPHKVCSLDCVYCECGATTQRTVERREWVPTRNVLDELESWLEAGGSADHLTFSGAGEPTLHRDLGAIARWLVARTSIPLALLTNSTLLPDRKVRDELLPCSLILPSLDAADDATYRRINRPHPGLTAADLIEGLVALRDEFVGQIWLEIVLIEGLNDSNESLDALAAAVARIRPDRVQINTAVRPGTLPDVGPASEDVLERALARFGPTAEPVASFHTQVAAPADTAPRPEWREAVLAVVRRRPETLKALAGALSLPLEGCRRTVLDLLAEGLVTTVLREGEPYFVATERDGAD